MCAATTKRSEPLCESYKIQTAARCSQFNSSSSSSSMILPIERPEFPLDHDDALAPSGAMPVVMSSMSFELSDLFLGALIFYLAAEQESEISGSPHYLAMIFVLLAFMVLFNVLKRRLAGLSARKTYTKHSLTRFLIRLIVYAGLFLSGVFSRTMSGTFLGGPRVGTFSLWTLVMPVTGLVAFLHLLFLLTSRGSPRLDIVRLTS